MSLEATVRQVQEESERPFCVCVCVCMCAICFVMSISSVFWASSPDPTITLCTGGRSRAPRRLCCSGVPLL